MKQILVADNHPVIREQISDLVGGRGHAVHTAEDGLAALRLLESVTPDVVFIDLVMPYIDGARVCRVIRRRPELNACLIVALSDIAAEEEGAMRHLDADMVLAKGTLERLLWHVDYIIKHVEARRTDRLRGEMIGRLNLFPRQITRELLTSHRDCEQTLNHLSEGLVKMSRDARITYANPAAAAMLGACEEDLLSADFVNLLTNGHRDRIRRLIRNTGSLWKEPVLEEILEFNHRLLDVKIVSFQEPDQQYILVTTMRDVTEQRHTEQRLMAEKEKYRQERNFLDNLFENSPDAIAILDAYGRVARWNHNAQKMFGFNFEELKGKNALDLYPDRGAMQKMLRTLRRQGYVQNYEIELRHKEGSLIPCAISASWLKNENQQNIGTLNIIRDLTEWKQVEARLKYLSFHDSLTGVYNRTFFEEEMARLAKGRHLPLGLIVCDINKLKEINDAMGHQKGDELIQKAAGILKRAFRAGDIIARIGGDEFAVLVPQGTEAVIKDCVRRIREEIELGEKEEGEPHLSIAIGYAISDEPPVDTKALFKQADDHMYRQKSGQS